MGYFWSPPLFILKVFINCLIVLQLLTIWLSISHYVVLASILINYDFYAPFFTNDNIVLKSCTNFGYLNFHFSHLTYENFNLCLQNTLNLSKTTRVYFGVLHKKWPLPTS